MENYSLDDSGATFKLIYWEPEERPTPPAESEPKPSRQPVTSSPVIVKEAPLNYTPTETQLPSPKKGKGSKKQPQGNFGEQGHVPPSRNPKANLPQQEQPAPPQETFHPSPFPQDPYYQQEPLQQPNPYQHDPYYQEGYAQDPYPPSLYQQGAGFPPNPYAPNPYHAAPLHQPGYGRGGSPLPPLQHQPYSPQGRGPGFPSQPYSPYADYGLPYSPHPPMQQDPSWTPPGLVFLFPLNHFPRFFFLNKKNFFLFVCLFVCLLSLLPLPPL